MLYASAAQNARPFTGHRFRNRSGIAKADHRDGLLQGTLSSARTSDVVIQSIGEPTQHVPKPRAWAESINV